MPKNIFHKCTHLLLYVLFAAIAIIWASLPWMLNRYFALFFDAYFTREYYRTFILIFLMVCGLGGLWIIGELILIFGTLEKDAFVPRNVPALRRMGIVALSVAGLMGLKCVFFFTPMTLICLVALALCGLFSMVLADVFRRAVQYKLENDLTI